MDLLSTLALWLALAFAFMGLKLWELLDLAGPLLLILLIQTLGMAAFAAFVTFRALGANYDAAIMAAGHCGFGMGATPTAIANMQAVTARYGPSPQAFIVVPMIGAFFTTLQAPAQALQDLFAKGGARLLSVSPEVQKNLLKEYGIYRPVTLPAYTYPGQHEPATTLGVTATLIVRADLPDARVEQLLNGLFKSVTTVAQDNLRVTLLSPRTAREGITIPFHPAADRYFAKLDEAKRK